MSITPWTRDLAWCYAFLHHDNPHGKLEKAERRAAGFELLMKSMRAKIRRDFPKRAKALFSTGDVMLVIDLQHGWMSPAKFFENLKNHRSKSNPEIQNPTAIRKIISRWLKEPTFVHEFVIFWRFDDPDVFEKLSKEVAEKLAEKLTKELTKELTEEQTKKLAEKPTGELIGELTEKRISQFEGYMQEWLAKQKKYPRPTVALFHTDTS